MSELVLNAAKVQSSQETINTFFNSNKNCIKRRVSFCLCKDECIATKRDKSLHQKRKSVIKVSIFSLEKLKIRLY